MYVHNVLCMYIYMHNTLHNIYIYVIKPKTKAMNLKEPRVQREERTGVEK